MTTIVKLTNPMDFSFGVIDTESNVSEYRYLFEKHGFGLKRIDTYIRKEDIFNWICDNHIELLIIGYNPEYKDFTDIVLYLNSVIPDLYIVVVTKYAKEVKDKSILLPKFIYDVSTFIDDVYFCNVLDTLNTLVCGFRTRCIEKMHDYKLLYSRYDSLTKDELDMFKLLQSELYRYGLITVDQLIVDTSVLNKICMLNNKLGNISL